MEKLKRKKVLMMRNIRMFSLPQNRNPLWLNSIMLLFLRSTEIDFGFSGLMSFQVIKLCCRYWKSFLGVFVCISSLSIYIGKRCLVNGESACQARAYTSFSGMG